MKVQSDALSAEFDGRLGLEAFPNLFAKLRTGILPSFLHQLLIPHVIWDPTWATSSVVILEKNLNFNHGAPITRFSLPPLTLHVVENLAEVIQHGTRDQQSDALVSDLNNHFEKCQHLLNSIVASLSTQAMTVEGQRRKLEESEQLLNQWRDLIAKYRSSVVELVKFEP
nr:mediator of rna polymerase ii transcription subunit 9 [Quercus suber]